LSYLYLQIYHALKITENVPMYKELTGLLGTLRQDITRKKENISLKCQEYTTFLLEEEKSLSLVLSNSYNKKDIEMLFQSLSKYGYFEYDSIEIISVEDGSSIINFLTKKTFALLGLLTVLNFAFNEVVTSIENFSDGYAKIMYSLQKNGLIEQNKIIINPDEQSLLEIKKFHDNTYEIIMANPKVLDFEGNGVLYI